MQAAFEFAGPTRIVFGSGAIRGLPDAVAALGQYVLVVTGRNPQRWQEILDLLVQRNLSLTQICVEREPTTRDVTAALATARQAGARVVLAIGGGSVLDVGKAVAGLLTNCDALDDYLEGIGRGRPLEQAAAPFVAVPTTAGTGSEATRNAVLRSVEQRVKVSLRSPVLLPRLALVDPALTLTAPAALTATTGLDTLTQLIEPFVSWGSNPLTDALCREGIARIARSLPVACRDGSDLGAREDLSLASLFGGIALANAKLGGVHGLAGAIGGLLPDAAHGAVCARLLPSVMAANIRALKERDPESAALARYREVARLLTGDPEARSIDGIHWLQEFNRTTRIPSLSASGLVEDQIAGLIELARRASSMQGNPIKLSREELAGILVNALLPDATGTG
jgi:alcohol dehydrogenase class IV